MYGQLGDIVFDGLFGPDKHIRRDSVSLPQHKRINRRPRNQFTGVDLGKLKLSIRLHISFVEVEETIEKIRNHRNSATHLKYITGSGNVIGTFLIHKTKEKRLHEDKRGNIVEAELELELVETVSSTVKNDAVQNAAANSKNLPAPALRPIGIRPANMGVSAALDVSAARSLATAADVELATADPSIVSQTEATLANVKDKVETARQHMADAAAKVQQYEATIQQAQDYAGNMLTAAQNAQTMVDYIDGFDPADPVGSLNAVNTANREFMSSMAVMSNTSQPLAGLTGSRR